jgi:predicted DNA-binding transcriptional regulator AlpA
MSEKEMEISWLTLKQAAPLMGMTVASIKNSIQRGTFPVPTYFLGRVRVVDKQVLEAFFSGQRDEGLRRLAADPKPTRPR